MGKHSITNINYHLMGELSDHKIGVGVYFLFDGKPTKKLFYFQKRSGFNYVKEAQRITEKELESGKLVRFAKKYHKKRIIITNSKLGIITTSLVLAALALGGFFTWRYFNPLQGPPLKPGDPVSVEIKATDEGGSPHSVTVTNTAAIVGDPYRTEIKLEEVNLTRTVLPETLDKVTSGGKTVSPDIYAYEITGDTSAELLIPGEYVTGAVDIKLTLRTIDVTVAMIVEKIDHCSVFTSEKEIHPGETYSSFPTTEQEFYLSIDTGYELNNSCFNLSYNDIQGEAYHRYDAINKTLTVRATHDFTFSVTAVVPEGSVLLTANYDEDCKGVYYGVGNLIKSGASTPVKVNDDKKIETIGINVDESITSLTTLEFTCSLEGAKIEIKEQELINDFDYEIAIDLTDCAEITDLTLDIHPGVYRSIKVGITKGEYCSIILYNNVEVSYETPNEVTPVMTDAGSTVSFDVVTQDSILNVSDIEGCEYTPTVQHVINNTYKITFTNIKGDFNMHVNPGAPLDPVGVTLTSNKRCTITYKGIPVTDGKLNVIPLLNEEEQVKTISFGVNLKEDVEFNEEHTWISKNAQLKNVQPTVVSTGSSSYIVTVSISETQDFTDFTMEIKPGNPFFTMKGRDGECIVYLVNENHQEELIELNTPYEFDPDPSPTIGRSFEFHIELVEGYYVNDFILEQDSGWRNDVLTKIPGEEKLLAKPYDNNEAHKFADVVFEPRTFEVSYHPDINVNFNKAVESVTYEDETIYESDTFKDTKIYTATRELYIQTNNVVITQNEDVKQITFHSDDPGVQEWLDRWFDSKLEPISGNANPYLYKLSIKFMSTGMWTYVDSMDINIFPEEDTTISTFTSGDTGTYTLKYGEQTIGTEETELTLKKGVYEYEFTVDPDESHDVSGYEARIKDNEGNIINLGTEATDTGVKVKFDGYESYLNNDNIESLEIVVHTREKVSATATFTFDENYSIYDVEGNSIVSGTPITITEPTFTCYVNTTEEMNSEYVLIEEGLGITKTVTPYEGEGDYNYVLTLGNITSSAGEFDVEITRPAMIALDEQTANLYECAYADESGMFRITGSRISINEFTGSTEVEFLFSTHIDGSDYRFTVEAVDPIDEGMSIISATQTFDPQDTFHCHTITFSKPITLGTVITISIEAIS